jgi:hypothetical protein
MYRACRPPGFLSSRGRIFTGYGFLPGMDFYRDLIGMLGDLFSLENGTFSLENGTFSLGSAWSKLKKCRDCIYFKL